MQPCYYTQHRLGLLIKEPQVESFHPSTKKGQYLSMLDVTQQIHLRRKRTSGKNTASLFLSARPLQQHSRCPSTQGLKKSCLAQVLPWWCTVFPSKQSYVYMHRYWHRYWPCRAHQVPAMTWLSPALTRRCVLTMTWPIRIQYLAQGHFNMQTRGTEPATFW